VATARIKTQSDTDTCRCRGSMERHSVVGLRRGAVIPGGNSIPDMELLS